MARTGWTGMDQAFDHIERADPAAAIPSALASGAEVAVEQVRAAWPVKTGASRDGWQAAANEVRNERPDTSHIGGGLADQVVRDVLLGPEVAMAIELEHARLLDLEL